MYAYSTDDLNNFHLQQQAENAFDQGIISKQTLDGIKLHFHCKLYTPGIFIRIALALLCIVCIVFAGLLFFLIMGDVNNFSGIFLILFIVCYGLLEFMVKTKKYYNAGIDNTLQFFTIVFFSGMFADGNYANQDVVISIAVLFSAIWLCIRFTDAFMALIAYAAYLVLIFLLWQHAGNILYAPFILMIASSLIFILQHSFKKKERLRFYSKNFLTIAIATLISFYAACNVYVVFEGSKEIWINGIIPGKNYIILFWVLSSIIPVGYMLYGFRKKQSAFLRVGFLSLIATILTMHYYYALLSTEAALIIAGFILLALGYAGLKYLKNNRFGFTARSYKNLNNDLYCCQNIDKYAGRKPAYSKTKHRIWRRQQRRCRYIGKLVKKRSSPTPENTLLFPILHLSISTMHKNFER